MITFHVLNSTLQAQFYPLSPLRPEALRTTSTTAVQARRRPSPSDNSVSLPSHRTRSTNPSLPRYNRERPSEDERVRSKHRRSTIAVSQIRAQASDTAQFGSPMRNEVHEATQTRDASQRSEGPSEKSDATKTSTFQSAANPPSSITSAPSDHIAPGRRSFSEFILASHELDITVLTRATRRSITSVKSPL